MFHDRIVVDKTRMIDSLTPVRAPLTMTAKGFGRPSSPFFT
jgi:hypothetical protein